MRFYRLLVRFFRMVNQLYFTRIHTIEGGRIPQQGPVIIAANHPSSILDSILLGTQVPRCIRYLATSRLFRWPILAGLFRQLGAIPVYRRHEAPNHAERNTEAFEQVYRLLGDGGCVGIFPEGRNSPVGRVGELRTGAARIALGAEARHGYGLGVVIVPVGITFENREFLTAAVVLSVGDPIRPADYASLHRRDPEAGVRALTDDLQDALRAQTVHIEDHQLHPLVDELATILAGDPVAEYGLAPGETDATPRRFPLFKHGLLTLLGWYQRGSTTGRQRTETAVRNRRRVSAVLDRAIREEPERLEALRRRVDRYNDHLYQWRLQRSLRESFDEPVRGRLLRLRMTIYAVAMAPIAAFGLVHNAVPFVLTWVAARGFSDEAIRLFSAFALGIVLFPATYAGFGWWAWQSMHMAAPWALLYTAALPLSGLVALRYRRDVLIYRDAILFRSWFWSHRELAQLMEAERDAIVAEFRALARRLQMPT